MCKRVDMSKLTLICGSEICLRKIKKSFHALKYNGQIEEKVISLSTSLYMHYFNQYPDAADLESQNEMEEVLSPLSPGPENRLMHKRISLSAVQEIEEKNFEDGKDEGLRLLKPTKISKINPSYNDFQDPDVNLINYFFLK